MLENVEYNGNNFSILYGDRYSENGFSGMKSLLAIEYFNNAENGLCVSGSRDSMQVLKFSQVATKINKNIEVFIPTGKDTEMISQLKKTKANINRIPYGYKTVLNKRSRDCAEEKNMKSVQVGMLEEFAFSNIEKIYQKLTKGIDFNLYNDIIFPVGSGTSLIGFCRFCQSNGIKNKIIGVSCGMSIDKVLKDNCESFPDVNLEIVQSNYKYDFKFKNNLGLNETYEAKLLDFTKDNDLLITVDL